MRRFDIYNLGEKNGMGSCIFPPYILHKDSFTSSDLEGNMHKMRPYTLQLRLIMNKVFDHLIELFYIVCGLPTKFCDSLPICNEQFLNTFLWDKVHAVLNSSYENKKNIRANLGS